MTFPQRSVQPPTVCEAYTAGVNPRPTIVRSRTVVQSPSRPQAYHARSAYHFCLKSKNITFVLQNKYITPCLQGIFPRPTAKDYSSTTPWSPLSRLRTRSSFGSNNTKYCFSHTKTAASLPHKGRLTPFRKGIFPSARPLRMPS